MASNSGALIREPLRQIDPRWRPLHEEARRRHTRNHTRPLPPVSHSSCDIQRSVNVNTDAISLWHDVIMAANALTWQTYAIVPGDITAKHWSYLITHAPSTCIRWMRQFLLSARTMYLFFLYISGVWCHHFQSYEPRTPEILIKILKCSKWVTFMTE